MLGFTATPTHHGLSWEQRDRWRSTATTSIAFAFLGIASWLTANATYVEWGIFLERLPEHYSIPAYSQLALESANIYPCLYMYLNARHQRMRLSNVVWILLLLSVAVQLLLSFYWDFTMTIYNQPHSVGMLTLSHLGGLVSTTSNLVFYPYVALYPASFTTALSTGEGLSGSIAALLGMLQSYDAIHNTTQLSVECVYIVCACITTLSVGAFAFLEWHPWAKRAKYDRTDSHSTPLLLDKQQQHKRTTDGTVNTPTVASVRPWLICQALVAICAFGIVPAIMPYVYRKCAPAETREQSTARYQELASMGALVLDPLARLLTSRWRNYHLRSLTTCAVVIALTMLVVSLCKPLVIPSPHSHLYLIPLITHVFFRGLYAYTTTMIFLALKKRTSRFPKHYAQKLYQWSGFATQMGAFVGTLVIFPLVLFHEQWFL